MGVHTVLTRDTTAIPCKIPPDFLGEDSLIAEHMLPIVACYFHSGGSLYYRVCASEGPHTLGGQRAVREHTQIIQASDEHLSTRLNDSPPPNQGNSRESWGLWDRPAPILSTEIAAIQLQPAATPGNGRPAAHLLLLQKKDIEILTPLLLSPFCN